MSGSRAFAVGFAVFLVVLVFGLLAVALYSISENQGNNAAEAELHSKSQSPALSAMAAMASVIVFFSGIRLFFKKSPSK